MEASRRISDDIRPTRNASYVAADINKIALGTSFIDMLFHNPVVLARRFATLDVLSEGRAVAGFGIGWSKDEYQASNISFKDKGRRADKFIQVLKRIWTDEKGIATMTLILLGSDDIGKF
jgi:alkanesulfonate monooxygenase SsuD/methylene tetrahydromethanopterin reductase-like flavin-dependent oxidoreductase (luciferase family)